MGDQRNLIALKPLLMEERGAWKRRVIGLRKRD
jgi:hypothetical protein